MTFDYQAHGLPVNLADHLDIPAWVRQLTDHIITCVTPELESAVRMGVYAGVELAQQHADGAS